MDLEKGNRGEGVTRGIELEIGFGIKGILKNKVWEVKSGKSSARSCL